MFDDGVERQITARNGLCKVVPRNLIPPSTCLLKEHDFSPFFLSSPHHGGISLRLSTPNFASRILRPCIIQGCPNLPTAQVKHPIVNPPPCFHNPLLPALPFTKSHPSTVLPILLLHVSNISAFPKSTAAHVPPLVHATVKSKACPFKSVYPVDSW